MSAVQGAVAVAHSAALSIERDELLKLIRPLFDVRLDELDLTGGRSRNSKQEKTHEQAETMELPRHGSDCTA